MGKIDKLKKIIRILLLLLVIFIIVYILMIVLPKKKNNVIELVDETKFGYTLSKRDTDIYKDTFKLLKEELAKDTIDYEKYAEYISKLFIIDLYTLSNKKFKDDVGGVQFVKDEIRDNYKLNVSNTLYKYIGVIDNNVEISKIDLVEIKEINYKISNKDYVGYEVNLKWEYKVDNDYDKEGTIILVRDNDKLYIVEKK